MGNNKRYLVIGGDLRSIKLAQSLETDGAEVCIYGFDNTQVELTNRVSQDLKESINNSDIIIGPTPCSIDNETINTTYSSQKIYLNEVFKAMGNKQIFTAGRISEKIAHMAEVYNVYTIDLLEREEMSVLNSIPTAEGAIQIAMEQTPITIHGSNILVIGYGRIGKTLAKMLYGIGAKVHVAARKYSDIAWVKSYGYTPIVLNDLSKIVSEMEIIINTVPSLVLNSAILENVRNDCLIIDLASKPGGVDLGV